MGVAMSTKNRLIMLGVIIAAIVVFTLVIIFGFRSGNERYVSVATASKMLALLDTSKTEIMDSNKYFEDNEIEGWYEKYINYMMDCGYLTAKKGVDSDYAYRGYKVKDLRKYLKIKEVRTDYIEDATGVRIDEMDGNDRVLKEDFLDIYEYLVALYGGNDGVYAKELTIAGTPSNVEGVGKWQACTDKGDYGFEGLSLDTYLDCRIVAYVRDKEIVAVKIKLSDEVTYMNVWLEKGQGNTLVAFIAGVRREFYTDTLGKEFSGVVGDIKMKSGKVCGVVLKQDMINGKVLMVDNEKVEIEGYGVLELSENFHAYKTFGIVEEMNVDEIMVGYSITDFVVVGDKVCAAITSETLIADNIRVLVMTTGFTSIFHERVSLTATTSYTVRYGEMTERHEAGEIVDLYKDCSYLEMGRVIVDTEEEEGKITVLNVSKGGANPSYRGSMEVACYDEGLVLINDVMIEEYLYAVVPSEMPVEYGVEALKVQAICARSYAYRQLMNNSYSRYGAHVDDSVTYQVYNNSGEKEASTRAVQETYGQVLAFNGSPISTYYYSTSCGHTSDPTVWNSSAGATPYLQARDVDPTGACTDLSSETAFREFIMSVDETDYDYGYPYYRWSITLTLDELSRSINQNLYSRYCANTSKIQVLRNGEWVSEEIRNIGKLEKIEVVKRSMGGGIAVAVLYGSEAVIKVENELNIRYLLNPEGKEIEFFNGEKGARYILPSAYCILDEVDGGYRITGGGYGHGIGMSQNAVEGMVKNGMNYRDILAFFYMGTEIMNVYE